MKKKDKIEEKLDEAITESVLFGRKQIIKSLQDDFNKAVANKRIGFSIGFVAQFIRSWEEANERFKIKHSLNTK